MRQRPTLRQSLVVAVVAVAAAYVCRLLLTPLLSERIPFVTFFPAMFVVAWWGGLRPTFVATVLSIAVLLLFILEPLFSFAIATPEYRAGLVVFALVALAAGWFGEQMHRARWKERQAMSKAVAEEERLRVTLASIGDAVIVTDEHGKIVSLNSVAESLTGWKQDEAGGKPLGEVFRIINESTRQPVEDPNAKVLRTGAIVGLANHTVLISRSGVERPIDDSAAPIFDTMGSVRGVVLVFRDISSKRQAERALAFLARASSGLAALVDRESALRQSARLAVPHLADWCVVYVVDENSEIEYHAHAHVDPEKERLLARMLTESPLDWNSNTATVRALRSGESQLMPELPETFLDSVAQSEDHRQIIRQLGPRAVIAVPLKIRDKTIGVLGLVSCDSGRRFTKHDVQLAENFAEQVSTAVDNARLFYAVKEASRQKDEFLAMLAHELRNPLAAIRYAVALGQISNGDTSSELLQIIERQTQNLARLIDDLLDVSRISGDKITLRKEHIDVATIVNRATATVRPLLDQKQHHLNVELAAEAMVVNVDPTRAEQIIANLLTNAAKYTKVGGRVTVQARRDANEAVIQVIDTGVGLPPEMLSRVFDLFAQADRTLDRAEGGLGIGLTVARKLAEMHGGTIAADSEGLGKGSTFTLRLPLVQAPAEGEKLSMPPLQVADGPKLRVLVVDDNHDTARACALLLKLMGHEVETAHDGVAALERAREFQPQAFFLDIGLPGMNGYDLATTLRSEGFEQELMVAISGYGQPEDRRRSLEAGFDQHLVKPVDQAALASALNGVNGKKLKPVSKPQNVTGR